MFSHHLVLKQNRLRTTWHTLNRSELVTLIEIWHFHLIQDLITRATLHVSALFFPTHSTKKSPFLNSRPIPAPNSWRSNYSRSDGPLEKSPDNLPTHKSSEKKRPCFSNLNERRVQGSVFPIAWSSKHTYLWSFTYKHLILNGTSLTIYHSINCWKPKGSSTVDLDRQAKWILPWNLSTQCCLHADTLSFILYTTIRMLIWESEQPNECKAKKRQTPDEALNQSTTTTDN